MVPLLGIVHPARPEVRFALVDSDDRFRGEIEEQAASRPHNVRCLGTFDSLLSAPVTLLKRLGIHVLLIDPDIPGFPLPSLLQCLRAVQGSRHPPGDQPEHPAQPCPERLPKVERQQPR